MEKGYIKENERRKILHTEFMSGLSQGFSTEKGMECGRKLLTFHIINMMLINIGNG